MTFLITNAYSFVIPQQQTLHRIASVSLEAKKKKTRGGKGFGKEVPSTKNVEKVDNASMTTAVVDESPTTSIDDGSFLKSVSGGSDAVPTVDESIPVEERTKAILRDNYGLRTREEQQEAYKSCLLYTSPSPRDS